MPFVRSRRSSSVIPVRSPRYSTGSTFSAIGTITPGTALIRASTTTAIPPEMQREARVTWVLVAMIVWSIVTVGAVYVWAAAPLMAAAALVATLDPPRPGSSSETRILDRLLLASVGASVLQLVPLPPAVRIAISPNADRIPAAIQLQPIDTLAWRPISVSPVSTAYAIALVLTALVLFWTARKCCARGMTHR